MNIGAFDGYDGINALSPEGLAILAGLAEYRELNKGEALLKCGQVCTTHFLVDKGYLRTYYDKDGVNINTWFSFEGDLATNLKSLKTQSPSESTIEAAERSGVWLIGPDTLSSIRAGSPEVLLFTRRVVTQFVFRLEEHSNLFKLYNPTERYRYIAEKMPHMLQRVSLSQLASFLGVTRETLGNIRRKLSRQS